MSNIVRICDMGYREVIDLHSGARLGFVRDAEIDLEHGKVLALIVPGKLRFFGLLGREAEVKIPWSNIEKIGEDLIFVKNVGRLR